MKKQTSIKICRNKKCKKILPEGYKYNYCEACRNQRAEAAKKVMIGVGATAGAILSVVAAVAGIKPKKN